MKIVLVIVSFFILALALLFTYVFVKTNNSVFLGLSVTFFTIFYHFVIRFVVGYGVDFFMKNKADYNKRWYRTSKKEIEFYKRIKVKEWKKYAPSYDASLFDTTKHSWSEVIQAMCQAEVIHETVIVLSYIPLLFSIIVGHFFIFLLTSFIASLFDLSLVFIQRYNRNRIIHSFTFFKEKDKGFYKDSVTDA